MATAVVDLDLLWDADHMVARRVRVTSDVARPVAVTARAPIATTTATGAPLVATITRTGGIDPRRVVDQSMTTHHPVDATRTRTDATMALHLTPTSMVDHTTDLLVTSLPGRVAATDLVKAAVILARIIVEAAAVVGVTDTAPILRV